MPDQPTYEVGSTVVYRTIMGGLRRARVTARHADIKNGEPGFDAVDVGWVDAPIEGDTVWGYDDQIIQVIPTAEGEPHA